MLALLAATRLCVHVLRGGDCLQLAVELLNAVVLQVAAVGSVASCSYSCCALCTVASAPPLCASCAAPSLDRAVVVSSSTLVGRLLAAPLAFVPAIDRMKRCSAESESGATGGWAAAGGGKHDSLREGDKMVEAADGSALSLDSHDALSESHSWKEGEGCTDDDGCGDETGKPDGDRARNGGGDSE